MSSEGIAVFAFDQRGFGQTSLITKSQGVTSWSLALGDINHFVEHTHQLFPDVPLFLVGHSMGGGLSLAFATRNPSLKSLQYVRGVVVTGPLLRQTPAVKTPPFMVTVGSLLGKIAPGLTMKTVVNPSVSFIHFRFDKIHGNQIERKELKFAYFLTLSSKQ